MERKKLFKFFIGIFFLGYIFNNFFTEGMITGEYVSNNTKSLLEGPSRSGEKLFLLDDNKFESDTWGNGTYKLKYTFGGTRIDFTYNYEFGRAGYLTSINRSYFFGKPQIILDRDLEFYFEKIK